MPNRTIILNQEQITQKINRIAHQIWEEHYNEKELILLGITGEGYQFAKQTAAILKKVSKKKISLGKIIIDKKNPFLPPALQDIDDKGCRNKVVIVFDDVLKSGKILTYSCKFLLNTPLKKLQCAILVNRDHRDFPVAPDFVGLSLSTTLKEHVTAELTGKKQLVYLS